MDGIEPPRQRSRARFNHIRTHTFRGKLYQMIFRKPRNTVDYWNIGQCENPKDKGRRMHVGVQCDAETILATVIHEGIHAAFWDITEEAVEEAERDIMRLLRRMGIKVTFEPKK